MDKIVGIIFDRFDEYPTVKALVFGAFVTLISIILSLPILLTPGK